MIPSIITHLNIDLGTLNLFTLYGLVKQEHKGDLVYPSIYAAKGNSDAINFDYRKATAYHRLTGDIAVTQEEDDTQCGVIHSEVYPMKLVCYFANTIYGDDAYSALRAVSNIKKELAKLTVATIEDSFGLFEVSADVTSFSVDSFSVWGDEFTGVPFQVPSTHSIISINYNITLIGSLNCFVPYEC